MRHHPRAFTIIELLISVGLITLLMGLVIASMKSVRNSAQRTDSLSSLRQMTLAFTSYSVDHRMQIMPGYIDETTLEELQIAAKLEDGTVLDQCADQRCDASSYVWRLAPYLDTAWETMYADYRDSTSITERLQRELTDEPPVYGPGSAGPGQLGVSTAPSFGMNSIFIGGDTTHGGDWITEYHPWAESGLRYAAVRFSEVKTPAKQILFGSAGLADPDLTSVDEYIMMPETRLPEGYVELRPPFCQCDDPQEGWVNGSWIVSEHGEVIRQDTGEYDDGAGLPIARWGKDRMPVANLDGSAVVDQISNLQRDMSRWSPILLAP